MCTINDPNKAVSLLIRARNSIADTVKEAGGCDHSVGICCCADLHLVQQIDDLLIRYNPPADVIYAFQSAGPGDFNSPVRKEWGMRAVSAIKEWSAEYMNNFYEE